jgi:sugar transferase (PEP-CTERM/EpsH1 system associated)
LEEKEELMRILVLTSRLPYPPNRGDRLRAYNFIKSFSREHEIHLISFISDESEQAYTKEMEEYCQKVDVVQLSRQQSALYVGINVWRNQPLQSLYYRSSKMQSLVSDKLSELEFDVIYIHLAQYVENRKHVYRIIDLTDVISREVTRSLPYRSPLSRLLYTIEQPRISRYEKFLANSLEETWLISKSDRQILSSHCPQANIQVISNGIDFDYFYPLDLTRENNSIIFTGHMGVAHNIDAAELLVNKILPLVQQQIPTCSVYIVGAEPVERVQKLANNPAVTVTGYVNNLNEYLNRASVFVAPLRFAAGVQNKVIEAMATSLPVITTSLVNEGINAVNESEILVSNNEETLSSYVIDLSYNEAYRRRIGQAGMEFVRNKYDWDYALLRMNEIQNNII